MSGYVPGPQDQYPNNNPQSPARNGQSPASNLYPGYTGARIVPFNSEELDGSQKCAAFFIFLVLLVIFGGGLKGIF